MTRGYQFTLASSAVKYNLWNDLITKDATFTDPTFSGRDAFGNSVAAATVGFFVPKLCCDLRMRLPFTQVANQGNTLSIQDAQTTEEKNQILTGELYEETSVRNSIDLSKTLLQPSSNGMVVDVTITSN
jgi:hypothetical protein